MDWLWYIALGGFAVFLIWCLFRDTSDDYHHSPTWDDNDYWRGT